MPFHASRLRLSQQQRNQLTSLIRRHNTPMAEARRARIILELAAGKSHRSIAGALHTSTATVCSARKRFEEGGVLGLCSRHLGSVARALTTDLRAKVLRRTLEPVPDGSTHWSCRKLAADLKLAKSLVHRVWQEAGMKPHRLERYMASTDPDFELKAADVIGLYLNPPQHAAVFCVDEKTAIQALDRLDPVLPLSPGRAERHGFEYFRHGTLSLFAALNTRTGHVLGKTAARHTSAEFVSFLQQLVAACPAEQPIHVILDNLSAHKIQRVREFLTANPRVRLHYTPTYSSWLNQVELWFAKIEPDLLARGIFTSVQDLSRKIMRYIRLYAKRAKPIRWKYSDPRRRIRP